VATNPYYFEFDRANIVFAPGIDGSARSIRDSSWWINN
jgi:hypothetical protein